MHPNQNKYRGLYILRTDFSYSEVNRTSGRPLVQPSPFLAILLPALLGRLFPPLFFAALYCFVNKCLDIVKGVAHVGMKEVGCFQTVPHEV